MYHSLINDWKTKAGLSALRSASALRLALLFLVLLVSQAATASSVWLELEQIPDTLTVLRFETEPSLYLDADNDTMVIKERIRMLTGRLSREGWWSAGLDSLVVKDNRATAHFTRGERYWLTGMRFDHSSNLDNILQLRQPATELLIGDRLREEMTAWREEGSAFTEITLQSVTEQQGEITLDWQVRREQPVTLNRLIIRGNDVTRAGVIQRLTRFQTGMAYSPSHWEKARLNLQRQIFIDRVEPVQLVRSDTEEYAALLDLKEAPSYFFSGNLGYSGGEAETGFWIWNIDIRLLNILGTARELYLLTNRTAPETRSISVRYREPFLLGSQLFLEPRLQQQDHDSTYHERQYGLTAGWRPNFTLEVSSGLSREEVFPDSLHGWIEQGIRQERNTVWRSSLSYDSRDDLLHPRAGILLSYSYEEKFKKLHPPGETETNTQRVMLQKVYAQQPLRILRFWTLLLEEQAQQLFSDSSLTRPDLFRVGGARSLRGYREEQFLVDGFLLGRMELRRQLGRGSDLHFFFDAALMDRDGVLRRETGYGLGLKLRIRQGYLGVDYALPGDGDAGDGKLHILYESLF